MAASRTTGASTRGRVFPEGVALPDALGLSGAIAELVACNALLARGFHVFRALSNSAPYDLVADINGELFRVEVKSVRAKASGELTYSAKNALDPRKYDILAQVVAGSDAVIFTPELDEINAVARVRSSRK